jgi:hypothetical protein
MTRTIDYRCKTCGSDEMAFDATAEWDVESQDFVVGTTYDTGWCNSEECQGEERDAKICDPETGEELGQPPGSFEYIPKAEADALWHAERMRRAAERLAREEETRHQQHITETAAQLAAAYEEIDT